MSGFIDWLRGGTWRGDAQVEVGDEFGDEKAKPTERDEFAFTEFAFSSVEMDHDLFKTTEQFWHLVEKYDEECGGISRAKELLEGNSLAILELATLEKRETELMQFWQTLTERMTEEMKVHLQELREFMEYTGFPDLEDEDEVKTEPKAESTEENFADLHGLDPNAEPEDVIETEP